MRAGETLALVLVLSGCTGKYVRETTDAKVEATPEAIARGNYIVNTIGACGACHTPRAGETMEDFLKTGERADQFLAGGMTLTMESMGATLYMPNLTPDVETGIGGWSDDQLIRGIRDGVTHNGDLMMPMMPFASYKSMSDQDVRAIVAYLRTVPPMKLTKPRGETDLGFMGNLFIYGFGVAHHEPAGNVPAPDKSDKVKYGEYVMRLGHCWQCHSSTGSGAIDVGEEGFMGGFDEPDDLPGVGKVYMSNLTPDEETGLGKYSAEQIKQAMRTGKRLDGKPMAPPMSLMMPHYSAMSDEDLDALVAFLKSIKPVKHKIPDRELLPEYERTLTASN